MAWSTDHPQAFEAWKDAGGIENNFHTHLVLTKQIPSTTADRLKIAAESIGVMQALIQLELTIAQPG